MGTREEKFWGLCIFGRSLQQRKDIVQGIIDTSNWPLPSAGGTFWKRQKPIHTLLPLCPATDLPLEALCVFMRLVPMLDCCQCISNSDPQYYSLWLLIRAIQNDIYMLSSVPFTIIEALSYRKIPRPLTKLQHNNVPLRARIQFMHTCMKGSMASRNERNLMGEKFSWRHVWELQKCR